MSQTKEINWDGIPLLTENALHEKLAEEKWGSVSAFLKKHSAASQEGALFNIVARLWPGFITQEVILVMSSEL